MTFDALATDYDGTLAHDGRVDEATVDALRRARTAGLKLVMVTGRQLSDLFNTFDAPMLFDRIVAENGALLYEPASKAVRLLAPPPPPSLVERLTRERVPLSVGHSIVATASPYEHALLAAIRELGIEWHVILNKGAVMALPAALTKATGLMAALDELGISAARTVAVGDAENDQEFMRACGFPVAVANALPSIKQAAALVTRGARGAGVVELIGRLLNPPPKPA